MPIKIPQTLPAYNVLRKENIFVMTDERAIHQDIRPLRIIILNIMPNKIVTEIQILRHIANTPIQVEIVFLKTSTYMPKNTSSKHLNLFYKTFNKIKNDKFDGLIITGAPVERLDFEEVRYWDELKTIMEWSKSNVFSTLHLCWGAQAGLYYHYKISKHLMSKKLFGVFKHKLFNKTSELLRGFDDIFYAPHSRYSRVLHEDIVKDPRLKILSESEDAEIYIATAMEGRQVFVMGHPEYDRMTLKNEYFRDKSKGLKIALPENYFPQDNPGEEPQVMWKSHANLLFANWLNYYVYQETPYYLEKL